jgi:hypothetical protein
VSRSHCAEFEDVIAVKETDKALLVNIDKKEHWCPKSAIHDDSEVYKANTSGKLVVKQWWAEKEGLV